MCYSLVRNAIEQMHSVNLGVGIWAQSIHHAQKTTILVYIECFISFGVLLVALMNSLVISRLQDSDFECYNNSFNVDTEFSSLS